MLGRPGTDEHAPYYGKYIEKVPDGDILATLAAQVEETVALLGTVAPEQERFAYAPGKWTIRQVVGHVIDTERLFGFRALWFARLADGALPSMDENQWAVVSNAGDRPLSDLIADLRAARAANLALFSSFDEETGLRRGVASDVEFTVRSLVWMVAGHELHHRAGLRANYGMGTQPGMGTQSGMGTPSGMGG